MQLGLWSSAVKYDWLAALTLAQVRDDRQYRYGGAGEIDPVFKFRELSRVLLFNAGWARKAVELADRLGLLARLRPAAPEIWRGEMRVTKQVRAESVEPT